MINEKKDLRKRDRRGYWRDWENRNKESRTKRFLNKKEAEIILKHLPNIEETKSIIIKLNKIINTKQ